MENIIGDGVILPPVLEMSRILSCEQALIQYS